MISIICGTNRTSSKSLEIAKICQSELNQLDISNNLVDLGQIENFAISPDMYNPDNMSPEIRSIQENQIKPSTKWIVIVAEYNGGIPGIFKLFIDILSIRDKDANFKNKEALLIGVAAGRSGNLRGLDYLTNCLNYLGMSVFYQKLPISSINAVLKNGELNPDTKGVLQRMISDFVK